MLISFGVSRSSEGAYMCLFASLNIHKQAHLKDREQEKGTMMNISSRKPLKNLVLSLTTERLKCLFLSYKKTKDLLGLLSCFCY